ncbi:MAG: DUF4340 domain-containing protein [Desulfobacter sp.]|nr:DUF4340 domain-containing protein [Desulfobacter sp.]
MKKEYYILLALIIALTAYLFLKKDNQVHYSLPVLEAMDPGSIDKVKITRAENTKLLLKKDKTWTVTKDNFPADPQGVRQILDAITNLKLSALVSEAGDRVRYELDPPNAIEVSAFEGSSLKRRFFIGKTAPSLNHTFVMIQKEKQIFQADKNFRNKFDKSVDELRNKLVLEFTAKKIQKITIEKQGLTKVFVLNQPQDTTKAAEQDLKPVWQLEDGSQADNTAANDLLSSLSHLSCDNFLDPTDALALEKTERVCKIVLENKESLSLNLFELPDKKTMAGGKSTFSPYAFSLAPYKAKDIVSYVDTLLGIEPPKEKTPDTD